MNNYPSFLENLNDKQREICTSQNNYVLTACPGSGKTTFSKQILLIFEKRWRERGENWEKSYTFAVLSMKSILLQ